MESAFEDLVLPSGETKIGFVAKEEILNHLPKTWQSDN